MNKKEKRPKGKKVFAEISQAEYDAMIEIRNTTRYSIADQIRAGVRNILSNKENLKS